MLEEKFLSGNSKALECCLIFFWCSLTKNCCVTVNLLELYEQASNVIGFDLVSVLFLFIFNFGKWAGVLFMCFAMDLRD